MIVQFKRQPKPDRHCRLRSTFVWRPRQYLVVNSLDHSLGATEGWVWLEWSYHRYSQKQQRWLFYPLTPSRQMRQSSAELPVADA